MAVAAPATQNPPFHPVAVIRSEIPHFITPFDVFANQNFSSFSKKSPLAALKLPYPNHKNFFLAPFILFFFFFLPRYLWQAYCPYSYWLF